MHEDQPPTTVITLPPKQRVNTALAVVAGVLAVLVVVAAHDTFAGRAADGAPPAATPITTLTPAPTGQAPVVPNRERAKGKDHDD